MKIYVINLDKNKEKIAIIDQQLRGLSLPYVRFSAINGTQLSQTERNKSVNSFAWWCIEGYPIRPGQLGCALSHAAIYRKLLDSEDTMVCILEDDIRIDRRFAEELAFIEEHVDTSRPQVVLLHNHFSGEKPCQDGIEMRRIKYERCAESYVVTKAAAKALLNINFPIRRPCDHWGSFVAKGVIELYQMFPSVCAQRWDDVNYKSDVCTGDVVDVKKMTIYELIVWKLKRLFGKKLGLIFDF